MRNMSFTLTTEQIRNRTKTVTRRLGWNFLEPDDVVQGVEKCQGLKKGEKIKKLRKIKIIRVSNESLTLVCRPGEVEKEGFPNMSGSEFIEMFCKHNKCKPTNFVNRIEFEYINEQGVN